MRRTFGRAPGFALLAVLVIAALAAMAAATVVTAALAMSSVVAADSRGERASAAAEAGIAEALDRLSWGDLRLDVGASSSFDGALAEEAGAFHVELTRRASGSSDPWPRSFSITVTASCGHANRRQTIVAALAPWRLPRGLAVAGPLSCSAPVTLSGCGAYVQGDVTGREHIALIDSAGESLPGEPPVDNAHPRQWAAAGVHAGGSIFSGGVEVHGSGTADAADTDACSGDQTPEWCWALPGDRCVAALTAHGVDCGAALREGVLDLGTVAPGAQPGGAIVVVRAGAQPLRVVGRRSSVGATQPLTLVVLGDAVLTAADGQTSTGTSLAGELIVTGSLVIETQSLITGSLAVGHLSVRAPLTITLAADWSEAPPPGSTVAWTES